jgi:hypothetical protein
MVIENKNKARLIAFYLPQFHPIPENDLWWGKGFTEWTNVGKAKPLFKGHYQPHVPADLGYYDLRLSEVREAQADMARQAGIEGFCYWHYWFGDGRRLLERTINEVIESGNPNFPFCFAWANDSWKGIWHGISKGKALIEQTYPGNTDIENHFFEVLKAFLDPRYIRIDDKPVFMIYKPLDLPNPNEFINIWQNLAVKNGLKGIYFIGHAVNTLEVDKIEQFNFDAINLVRLGHAEKQLHSKYYRFLRKMLKLPRFVKYKDAINHFIGDEEKMANCFPTIIPNWDHSPRSGTNALILHDSKPELFEKHLNEVLEVINNKPANRQIAFIKSWNEWAEGNHLEPDLKFGRGYLNVLKKLLHQG